MSIFKYSTNLFLEKLEHQRAFNFLSKEGYKKQFSLTFTPGLFKSKSELNWLNGRVLKGSDTDLGKKTIEVLPTIGIDSKGDTFYSSTQQRIEIPQINTWYWVKISHQYSSNEEGIFSIDQFGNLTGTDSKLTEILRQLPNFPSKVKFTNAVLNTQEYQVLEVIDDTSAILNGSNFAFETGLKLSLVGTFTPSIIIPEVDKYPFQFDSSLISLVEEEEINQKPGHTEGQEFFLARLKVIDNQLIIQDKREDFITENSSSSLERGEANPLIGVEAVKFTDTNGNNESNLVEFSWNMRSTNWSVDTSSNILTLYGSSLGGRYKSVGDFQDGDFNGWRVYTENGSYSRVVSSVKSGNAINLLLDILEVNDYSETGGLTFLSQEVLICPDVDFVEVEFLTESNQNVYRSKLFPVNTSIGRVELLVFDFPTCNYLFNYRYIKEGKTTDWVPIPSDKVYGYYTETSFNTTNGLLKESGLVRKTYTSSPVTGFIELTAYQNNIYYIKNRLDLNFEELTVLSFPTDTSSLTLIPKSNQLYQVIDNDTFANNGSLEGFYVNLTLDTDLLRNGNRFVFIVSKDLSLSNKTVSICVNYESDSNPGEILKVITNRDSQMSKIREADVLIQVIWTGSSWKVMQDYELGQLGEVKMFSGVKSEYFDNSGVGKTGGWLGFAICNGSNGTEDLQDEFVLSEGSTTRYKKLFAKRIF